MHEIAFLFHFSPKGVQLLRVWNTLWTNSITTSVHPNLWSYRLRIQGCRVLNCTLCICWLILKHVLCKSRVCHHTHLHQYTCDVTTLVTGCLLTLSGLNCYHSHIVARVSLMTGYVPSSVCMSLYRETDKHFFVFKQIQEIFWDNGVREIQQHSSKKCSLTPLLERCTGLFPLLYRISALQPQSNA